MDKKKKIFVGLGILLLLSLVVLVISTVTKPKKEEFKIDGIELPEHKEILKDKTIGDIKITDVSLLTRDGTSIFKARVYNTSDNDLTINKLIVVLFLENEEKRVEILRDAKIAPGEFTYVSITSLTDLSKVTKIEYVLE